MKNNGYRFGSMLKFDIFSDAPSEASIKLCNAFGGRSALLEFCGKELDTVELHMIKSDSSPTMVLNAVKELKSYGLEATLHGTLSEKDEFFLPYSLIFNSNLQPFYNITVHPANTKAETERMLRDICDEIEEKKYPAFITLENQRMKSEDYFGVCADVTRIVNNIKSKHLGACFDFGHQLSNARKYNTDKLDCEFVKLARHTHIHSLFEGKTHFPLDIGETAFTKNLNMLFDYGFNGVFSLELAPDRYSDRFNLKDALVNSVKVLKTAVNQTVIRRNMANFYKKDYLCSMKQLKKEFEASENCAVLVGHSGYLLKFGETKIAVDIAMNVSPVSEEDRSFILSWVKDFDAYVLTHAHVDHYDPEFISELSDNTKKFIPDFIDQDCVNSEKTFDGAKFSVGSVDLRFFESGHTRENSFVREYGFSIKYKGESYIFPTDVRNYKFEFPKFENPRALFAHLWLGKGRALLPDNDEYIDDFCRFAESFGAKEIYVAHLHDVHRTVDEMWSELHFDIVKERINNLKMFKVGDIVKF